MFRRRTSRTALYERLLAAKEEQLLDLRNQIAAQIHLGSQARHVPGLRAVTDGQPAELGSATWDSDLDEATDILNTNGLSKVHLAEILDGLGVGSSDLS